jgi:hypothetical protein
MYVPFELPETRGRRQCQRSSYESEDEVETNAERSFRIGCFSIALDSAIMSLESKFLCDVKKLATLSTADLSKHCSGLELAVKVVAQTLTKIFF